TVTQVGTTPVGGTAPVTLRSITIVNNVGLSIVATGPATPVIAGNNITYSIFLANATADSLSNVVLSTAVPADTTFQSITAPTGFTCTNPAVGSTGAITCTGSSLASGTSVAFSLAVKATGTTNGASVVLMTSVKSDTVDSSNVRF